MKRRSRRGKMSIGGILSLILVVAGSVFLYMFFDPYWTWLKMQEITESVVLEWVAYNRKKADQRLDSELRKQDIPDYVTKESCEIEQEDKVRRVTCYWEVDVYYPFTEEFRTLYFDTYAEHDGVGLVTE